MKRFQNKKVWLLIALIVTCVIGFLFGYQYPLIAHKYPTFACSLRSAFSDTSVIKQIVDNNGWRDIADQTEAVVTVYNWFNANVEYSTEEDIQYTWQGVIRDGRANCIGQSEMFYLIMTEIGIKCEIVPIDLLDVPYDHAINAVYLDKGILIVDEADKMLTTPERYFDILPTIFGRYSIPETRKHKLLQ